VPIPKKLARLLRHAAEEEGIQLDAAGYANVHQVLENRLLRSFKVSFAELQELVRENDKQRFSMIPVGTVDQGPADAEVDTAALTTSSSSTSPKDWLIRANQGHSVKVESEGLFTPITADTALATAVHGTTHAAWLLIVASGGLKPMARNHVHFASGLPAGFKSVVESESAGEEAAPVISGMRKSSTVLMFLDVEKAMAQGLKLWLSENGVILSEGDGEGVVPLEVFKRVEDRTGQGVLLEEGKIVKEAPASWAAKGKGKG